MKKLRVLINPGHGYWQRPGKRSPWLGLDHPLKEKIMKMDGQKGPGWRLPEWATNKLIAEHICAAEYPDNLEVLNVMPDTERYGQFLSGRIAKGNKLKADLWVGIHSDADGSGNVFTHAGGHHVFYASARKEAEMQAALTLLYEKTTDAQGQAARESETYAGVTGRLNASFTNMQAEIGEALLPVLSDLAAYMEDVVPKIQAFFTELLDPTTELGTAWADLGEIFGHTTTEFNKMLAVFGLSGISFKDVLGFVTTLTAGFGQLFFMVGRVAGIIGALIALDIKKAFELSASFGTDYDAFVRSQNRALNPPTMQPLTPSQADRVQNVTINTYNSNITAQEIADKINKANRLSGTIIVRQP
jgi:hypothetical protein